MDMEQEESTEMVIPGESSLVECSYRFTHSEQGTRQRQVTLCLVDQCHLFFGTFQT
jgi:hypothetical protein